MAGDAVPAAGKPAAKDIRRIITASSLGTIFEWYDFFIYGTLAAAGIIGRTFFPTGNVVLESLLAWAGFAVGFVFRPLGAVLFGYFGDRFGRKYTFLITITIMGLATAGVGFIPGHDVIGIAAPILIISLRILQGLALGGEYGGATIYVAEHAPPGKAGFYTSFIQASVAAGFVVSLAVVLTARFSMPESVWNAWGWRIPFLFSLVLLAVSLWMRLKLSESPVFRKMKEEGQTSSNPFVESFTYPGNWKRILVALFGLSGGMTVIWYAAMFGALSFLSGPMRVEPVAAQLMVGAAAVVGLGWFILFGRLSDKVGRKKPIIAGYVLSLVLLFPMFWLMGAVANPALSDAARRAPVVVTGADCRFDPFAAKQATPCGQVLDILSKRGIAYSTDHAGRFAVTIGGEPVADVSAEGIDAALARAGYDFSPVVPSWWRVGVILFAVTVLSALAGLTYGPSAALMTEMFPARIRYSSLSIPYHFGTGYFGGFLPFISGFIIAKTGDPYAGLWYAFVVIALGLLVAWFGVREPKAAAQ